MSDRIEALKGMLAEDPNNSFIQYGLAMEYVRSGDLETAAAEFNQLLDADADYGAAYYHGGHALERMGRIDEARQMYERGIAATRRTGDAHTQSELQGALELLPI